MARGEPDPSALANECDGTPVDDDGCRAARAATLEANSGERLLQATQEWYDECEWLARS